MRKVAGGFLILLGIAALIAGAYFDIVIMIMGGVEQGLNGLDAQPHDNHAIAMGVVRVIYSGIGGIFGLVLCAVSIFGGIALMTGRSRRRVLGRF